MVVEIRQNRAANKVDRSQVLSAEITSSSPTYELIEAHAQILERLGNVTLKLSVGAPLNLKLNIPVDRARLEKENEGLEKQIANLDRQFANEQFMSKAPEKVIASMRQKKAEYEAQLAKNRAAL